MLKEENILFSNELSLGQRLSYLTLVVIYLEGWQQLILFVVPIVSLLFGIPPFEISIFNVFIILFYPILGYLLLQEMGCGFSRFWTNELFSLARFPVFLLAWRALLNYKMSWISSAKNMKGRVNLALLSPQILVLFLSVIALVYGVVRLSQDFQTGPIADAFTKFFSGGEAPDIFVVLGEGYTLELVIVSGFFAFYNGVRAIFMIARAYLKARRSEDDYSFNISLPVEIVIPERPGISYLTTKEISISKIKFENNNIGLFNHNQPAIAKIFLPSGPMTLNLLLVATEEKSSFWRQRQSDKKEIIIEARILWDGQEVKDKFMQSLLSVEWQREILNRNIYFLTPLEFLENLVSFSNPLKRMNQKWQPAILEADTNEGRLPMFICNNINGTGVNGDQNERDVITFKDFKVGETIEITHSEDTVPAFYLIERKLPVDTLCYKGLDGAIIRKYKCKVLDEVDSTTANI